MSQRPLLLGVLSMLLFGVSSVMASTPSEKSRILEVDRTEEAPEPPPPPRCECWQGTIVGNDTTTVEMNLCGQDSVVGTVATTSPRSGVSVRIVNGSRNAEQLALYDTGFVESDANLGWRFCLIDDYSLSIDDAGDIRGNYTSEACDDFATVELTYIGACGPPAVD